MLTIVKISRVMALEEDTAIDYLFNSMKGISPQSKAIVFAEQFNGTSPLVRKISQRANQEFPCTNIGENLGIIGGGINSTWLISEDNGRLLFDFFSLTIYIVEIKNGPHDLTKIADFMKYTISLSQGLRGKFIINIIVQEKINLEPFFWRVLSDGIDDISVIEWIPERSTDMNIIQSDGYNVYVNTFNHLNQTFTRGAMTSHTIMGLHRIKNFHGYPVNVERLCYEENCRNNFIYQPHEMLDIAFSKTLIEAINCSLRITHNPLKRKDDLSLEEINVQILDTRVPFLSTPFLDIASPPEGQVYYLSWIRNKIIPVPVSCPIYFHFMQQITYDEEISTAAIIAFAGLFFTAFVFAVWSQFLGFRERNWNFLNILTAQMGDRDVVMKSNALFRVTRIEGPIVEPICFMYLYKQFTLFKDRLTELINTFSEIGLIQLWREDGIRLGMMTESNQSVIVSEISDTVPLQQQLWPVIVVGSVLSIIALIGELIWKRWVEKT
ncbi:hypothetical protein QAD02_011543 [Eretmocerus hayati]|uniref:Uncharacterized protein n=1 Tax=Eretmocerus hayati TaxID=131215 RepID=A0ACC2NXB2_9HYME|nr:hypothetical protein QAD02_011543 [Eretmocerus hayati]